jgi:hypothetical protein
VKLSLSTPRRHIGEVEVQLHSFLTSALDGGEWSSSSPGRFALGKKAQDSLNSRLSGSQRRMDVLKENFFNCCQIWKARNFQIVVYSLYLLSYPDFLIFGVNGLISGTHL